MEYQLITSHVFGELNVIEKILTNRGIELSQISHYLHTDNQDVLDPLLITNLKAGVKMLISHIAQEHKIFIQVDSDCDGFTSAAVLINYLNCLFPGFVQNNISYRLHTGKQHGLLLDTIPKDVKLVIAPDSSSNDYVEHEQLAKQGIDVLVIDHHEAERISKYACVINNQLCDYPNKSLSGVGMVYKFCSYIDSLLDKNYANDYLDLVALGMIADMMDLKDFETHHLVTLGLQNIRNPYFKHIIAQETYSLRNGLTPIGIAFYIAPGVNATIRMGTPEEKRILFESMLEYHSYDQVPSTKRGCKGQTETKVEQACRNCRNIKNKQTKSRDMSLELIEEKITRENLLTNKLLIIAFNQDETIDKNLTGLIANQLMSKYQRPVLILNKTVDNEQVYWEGSGRGYDKSRFNDFRTFLSQSGLVEFAEGHANAFGIKISDSHLNELISYSNNMLKNFDFSPCYKVDFIFDGSNFRGSDVLDIASLNVLWGQGVEECLIAVENIKISSNNIKLLSPDKNPTIKIELLNGVTLIKFKSSKEEFDSLYSELGCITINIIGRCAQNEWNGNITPQIIIEDYEIIQRTEYYF